MTQKTSIHIESTDACNLFCFSCKTPHGTNFVSTEKFTILAEKLVGHTGRMGLHWRGEPCLHPRLPDLAQIARELGFKPWVSTNTAIPNLSNKNYVKRLLDNLDWIEFCVDGYDAKTTSKYRVGANWKVILKNLLTIGEIETSCTKKMRVLMFKYNDDKEDAYRNLARRSGMDEIIFASPLIGLRETISLYLADTWLSTNKKYRRYNYRNRTWHRSTGPCIATPIISVHGTVHPCCLDWDLEHNLGDLATEKWTTIMERHRKILPKLGGQKMCELCCVPGRRVNFMEKIK